MEGKARFFFSWLNCLVGLDKTLEPVMARKQAEQVARFRVTKATFIRMRREETFRMWILQINETLQKL